MYILESKFLTFNLYNLFSLSLYNSMRSVPSQFSAFFLLQLSSLFSKSFPSLPPPPFCSRVPTFWSNLRGNARYASYRFFSSCVAGWVFVRVSVLATNPLFSTFFQRKGETLGIDCCYLWFHVNSAFMSTALTCNQQINIQTYSGKRSHSTFYTVKPR